MKISEHIEILQKRLKKHGDIDVEIFWEDTHGSIRPSQIYLAKTGSLYINAENNYGKEDHAVDPNEGDDEDENYFRE